VALRQFASNRIAREGAQLVPCLRLENVKTHALTFLELKWNDLAERLTEFQAPGALSRRFDRRDFDKADSAPNWTQSRRPNRRPTLITPRRWRIPDQTCSIDWLPR
jgi:hypothetical protein